MNIDSSHFLPATSNLDMTGPYELTLEEFRALPVTADVLKARETIYGLQAVLEQHLAAGGIGSFGPSALTPVHRFTKGIYARELTMPPGCIIVGKRHAREHLVVMTEGFCTVVTERGVEDLVAPCTFTSPAGEKRVLFIHEQTTWTTIHRTDATDLQGVEDDVILTEPSPFLLNRNQQIEGASDAEQDIVS